MGPDRAALSDALRGLVRAATAAGSSLRLVLLIEPQPAGALWDTYRSILGPLGDLSGLPAAAASDSDGGWSALASAAPLLPAGVLPIQAKELYSAIIKADVKELGVAAAATALLTAASQAPATAVPLPNGSRLPAGDRAAARAGPGAGAVAASDAGRTGERQVKSELGPGLFAMGKRQSTLASTQVGFAWTTFWVGGLVGRRGTKCHAES